MRQIRNVKWILQVIFISLLLFFVASFFSNRIFAQSCSGYGSQSTTLASCTFVPVLNASVCNTYSGSTSGPCSFSSGAPPGVCAFGLGSQHNMYCGSGNGCICGVGSCQAVSPPGEGWSTSGCTVTSNPPPGGGGGGCNVNCSCDCDFACTPGCSCDTECGGGGPPPPPPPPTATPTPFPADFDVTNFYLTDANGSKTYSFDEAERIYWAASVINEGLSRPQLSTAQLYMNLYQNQGSTVNFTQNHTDTYISTPIGSSNPWSPNGTRNFRSYPGSNARESEFIGPNYFTRTGSSTNDGEPLFARIFVDPEDRVNESPGSEQSGNQSSFRYVVGPYPDLVIDNFELTDSNGVTRTQFSPNQQIFPKITIRNAGGSTAINRDSGDRHTYTQFYKNKPAEVAQDLAGDTNVDLRSGEFGRGASYTYYCRPDEPTNRCSAYTDEQYWQMPTRGRYTARAYVNYNRDVVEGRYSNNQFPLEYSVGYVVGGYVYDDLNKNGSRATTGEPGIANVNVQLYRRDSQGAYTIREGSRRTNASGYYEFDALRDADYRVFIAPVDFPNEKRTTTAREFFVTIPPNNRAVNFGFAPAFTVTGNIFIDTNGDGLSAGESNHPATPAITVTRPSGTNSPRITRNANGTYTVSNLIDGQYTFAYTPPRGYSATYPRPSQHVITFSRTHCTGTQYASARGATCDNNTGLANVNFGITQQTTWVQTEGGDVRFDDGFTNLIPAIVAPSCQVSGGRGVSLGIGTGTNPGVLFSGDTAATLGQGAVSVRNWQVYGNDVSYAPVNANSLRTSYDYVAASATRQGTTVQNLTSVTGCNPTTSCNIGATIASGVYRRVGNVTLQSFAMGAGPKKLLFLIDGSLRIQTPIDVPVGSSVVFIVKGDITVASTVGAATPPTSCSPPAVLEGFFSADNDFVVEGTDNCTTGEDRMLSVEGGIVVNAALGGGTIQMYRDLCGNSNYPVMVVRERPDIILNLPDLMKVPTYTWEEVAP